MIYIQHRQNSLSDLNSLPLSVGVEVDLRPDVDRAGRIFTAHDPYSAKEDFSVWLKTYAEKKILGPLILNTKADLLEEYLLKALSEHHIENYLFLGTTIPTLVSYAQSRNAAHFMLRLSAYESLDFCLQFKDKIKWLWVDCFEAKPLDIQLIKEAAKNFKLCLVSPELQGGALKSHISAFLPLVAHCSAICTKHIDLWQNQLQIAGNGG
jgi:hypothetical protein